MEYDSAEDSADDASDEEDHQPVVPAFDLARAEEPGQTEEQVADGESEPMSAVNVNLRRRSARLHSSAGCPSSGSPTKRRRVAPSSSPPRLQPSVSILRRTLHKIVAVAENQPTSVSIIPTVS